MASNVAVFHQVCREWCSRTAVLVETHCSQKCREVWKLLFNQLLLLSVSFKTVNFHLLTPVTDV